MLNRLKDKTNSTSRPSSKECKKAKTKASAPVSVPAPASATSLEATSLEFSTLSAVLQACRSDTKTSLTKLARLAKSCGASELASDIKAFAEQKNTALDALDLEVASLRESFEARFTTTTTTAAEGSTVNGAALTAETLQQQQQQQLLPEPLSVDDMFDEGILPFLTMKDISTGVAYVCKRWNRAARSEPLWKHLVKRDFINEVAPLCQVGIVLSNPTSSDQMTYLQFAENRFKSDAVVNKWLSNEMKEHPAIKKLLLYQPEEIGVLSWLANNDKVNTGAECLSMLARGVIVPEFFRRYEQVAIDAYAGRDKRATDYDPGEPVELPEVPQGLSARAVEHHRRARNAVARIYLKKNGELQTYKPRFSYYNDYALFLCSTGPLMSKSEILSSLSDFGRYYENETW